MKFYIYFTLAFFAISCNKNKQKELFVLNPSADILINNSIVLLKNEKLNGVLFELNINKRDTVFSERFKDGLLNGTSKKWYSNNQLMESREYQLGRKNGKQISFWENGNKRFEFIAKNDAYEGEMKEWNIEGKLIHLANYKNGQEDGTQKLWYDSGKIRANYVIINGKRYGLLGTKNCRNVSDSIFFVK